MDGLALGWVAAFSMLWGGALPAVQTWTGRDGSLLEADLVGFDWENKLLVLEVPNQSAPQMYYARNLSLLGKAQLFVSAPYRDALADNYEKVQAGPYFKIREKELSSLGVLMLSSYVVSFLGISWLLAGWAMPGSSGGRIFFAVVFLTSLTLASCYAIYRSADKVPGREYELILTVAAAHLVVFLLSAFLGFKARFFRSVGWWIMHWSAAILLPVTLLLTGLAAQVYKAQGSISPKAADQYLMETWFEPMGLL